MERIVDFQSYCPRCCYFNESNDAEQYICAECSAIAKRERTSVPKYFIYKYKSKNSGRYPWDKIEKEGFCSVCAIEKGSPTCEKWKNAKIILKPSSKLYYDSDERGYVRSICDDCYMHLKKQFKETEDEIKEESNE